MGVLLALRRLGDPEIARFLNDPDPRLVLEAAGRSTTCRSPAALPALAGVAGRPRACRCLCCGGCSTPTSGWARPEHAAALAAAAERAGPARRRARRWPWRCWPSGPSRRAATRSWGSGGRSRRGRPSRPPTRCGQGSRRSCPRRPRRGPHRGRARRRGPGNQGGRRALWRRWPAIASSPTRPAPRRSRPSIN